MNIHGFSSGTNDTKRTRPSANSNSDANLVTSNLQGISIDHLRNVERHKVLFLSGRRKVKNPKD